MHLTIYVEPGAFEDAAAASSGRDGIPVFPDLVIDHPTVVHRFAQLHRALSGPSWQLDREVQLVSFLDDLVARCATGVTVGAELPAHRAIGRAMEYLHDNPAMDVSLAELAEVSGLSRYRLARLFTATTGVPPHAYHVQLRIDHAKRLLLRGWSATDTAHASGFFDLSHFTRHFRRAVGVPPGAYAAVPHRG